MKKMKYMQKSQALNFNQLFGKRILKGSVLTQLDGSWEKDGVIFDYYIGQTGKHPAIRFLTHLLDYKKRSLSMKYIQEINFFILDNDLKRLAEEDALGNKYLDNGFKVYWN
jgi:hypothetical protein